MGIDAGRLIRESGIEGASAYADMFSQLPKPMQQMFNLLVPELQACAETDDYERFVRAVRSLNMGFEAYAPLLWQYRDAFTA